MNSMSDSDGETIHTDSDRSEDSDSEGSMVDFIDDSTPEKAITSRWSV